MSHHGDNPGQRKVLSEAMRRIFGEIIEDDDKEWKTKRAKTQTNMVSL